MPSDFPEPVPSIEYIDRLWASVENSQITWAELADMQATYLRDRTPIPVPQACDIPAIRRRLAARSYERAARSAQDGRGVVKSAALAMMAYWERQRGH